MRQLCPSCFQTIDVPEAAAGSVYPCPKCGKSFTVPPAYAPNVSPPPPADKPPAPPGLAAPPPPVTVPPAEPTTANPRAERAMAASLRWLPWVPAAGLTLAFVLTFFPWAGLYPGGVTLFTQLPWQAPFKAFSDNSALPIELLADEADLQAAIGRNWVLMLPYLALLLFSLGFAWLERFLKDPSVNTLPGPIAWVANVWPRRLMLLAVVTGVLFVLIGLQTLRGLAIETAAAKVADDRATKQLDDLTIEASKKYREMPADNVRKETWREVVVGQQYGRLGVRGTLWWDLAVLAHLAAFAAAAGRVWLDRREKA